MTQFGNLEKMYNLGDILTETLNALQTDIYTHIYTCSYIQETTHAKPTVTTGLFVAAG